MLKYKTLGVGAAIIAVLGLMFVSWSSVRAAEPTLPSGFALQRITTGQAAYGLTGFEPLPTGGFITTGKCGLVTFVPGGGVPRSLTTITTECQHDMGLLGFDLAADFSTSRRVYTLYTYAGGDGHRYARLSYWTLDSATSPTKMSAEQVIPLGTIVEDALSHGPGTVLAAPDGSLYVGFGDAASFTAVDVKAHRAQNPDQPYGKILRIDPQGRGMPGNPYYNPDSPTSWRSRVFAMGMRNPFRFTMNPANGHLYIGDVGWGRAEEHNVATAGANFGWPCYEGPNRTSGYSNTTYCKADYAAGVRHDAPLYHYSRAGTGAAAVGGVFTSVNSTYPAKYRNAYFIGDYAKRIMTVLRPNASNVLTAAPEAFGSNVGAPVDFGLDPATGEVVFADIVDGNLYRLRYTPGNRPPTASAAIDAARSNPDERIVAFDASGSYDLDGDTLTYAWDFGDGATGTGNKPTHTYSSDAPRTVTLRVSDGRTTATDTLTVHPANHVPVLRLTTPGTNHRFAVKEAVNLSVTATDVEDGNLTSNVGWQASLLHCPSGDQCHQHPGKTGTGANFSDIYTDHGSDTKMLIVASVTDQTGATVEARYEALPDVYTFSVNSPIPVTINGLTTTTWQAVVNETLTVAAPAHHLSSTFVRWSDGTATTSRSFTMPRQNASLTAQYNNAINAKYTELGGTSYLGYPTGNETPVAHGSWRPYQKGGIYWSPRTAAHAVFGGIYNKYVAAGGPTRWGFPTTDELAAPGGRYNRFERLVVGWTVTHGAHMVLGGNLGKYLALGGPVAFGLPLTDEVRNADGRGTAQHFTPNTLSGRSIYFYPRIGSYGVVGAIRAKWASLGYERSRLGYPVSDEFTVGASDRRSNFQRGYITWSAATKRTTVTYY